MGSRAGWEEKAVTVNEVKGAMTSMAPFALLRVTAVIGERYFFSSTIS
jgi:hypothetical protein